MKSWASTSERYEDYGLCHETDVVCAERVARTQRACEGLEEDGYLEQARRCGREHAEADGRNGCAEKARRRFISRVRSCTETS